MSNNWPNYLLETDIYIYIKLVNFGDNYYWENWNVLILLH